MVPSAEGTAASRTRPALSSRVRGQFVFRGVQAAQDLGRPVGEQAPGFGEPDAPPGSLDQPDAGLGFEARQVVAHRRLRVVQFPGGGGHGSVPGHRHQDAQPGDVEHVNDYR